MRRDPRRQALALLLLAYSAATCAQTDGPPAAAPAAESHAPIEMLLAVTLNHEDLRETTLFLRQSDGRILVAARDVGRWQLRPPAGPPVTHDGKAYYPLDAFKRLVYSVNEASQSIVIDAPPELFEARTISGAATAMPSPVPSSLGGFINYDGFIQYVRGRTSVNTLTELGAFSSWGVGTLNVLGQDLSGSSRFIRLDTTWTTDAPSLRASLRLGDSISRAAEWGGATRFGGLQWSTNFATQPRFISFAMPTVSGESVLPSTVDVYVNNALRLRQEVPSGPFSITDVPLVTGLGQAQVVVRDVLGREQVSLQSYTVSPRVLGRGVQDYSYEIGLARKNYGLASFDYGRAFAAATHRMGLTDRFTGEVHAELLQRQQTLGLNGAILWPDLGVFSVSMAGSNSGEAGALASLGFERLGRWMSLSARTQIATSRFTQIGLQPDQPAPRETTQASLSIATGSYGSVNLGYVRQDNRDRPDAELVNAGYNLTLGRFGALNLSYFRSLKGPPDDTVTLVFTRTLGERTTASVGGTLRRDFEQATAQIQQNLPRGSGYGYRLLAAGGSGTGAERYEAGGSLQTDSGLYSVEASRFGEDTGIRGSISGGVAIMGARPFLSRRLTNSFALVEVPEIPNVRIFADNLEVGKTDSSGKFLIPQLRAYDHNPIRIEQADLPMDAKIDALQLDAVPYFRSGYRLTFPIKRTRGALLRIVLANGVPMPAGATVQIAGREEEFPVALQGEVYLSGLEAHNHLRARWQDQTCEFEVPYPMKTDDPLPDLGSYFCKGVKP